MPTVEPVTRPESPPADDTAKWAALAARDAQADGSFVYAVRT
ncbi:MAG: bifunctional transcriptional activator/DNA repair enzyme protein Ada, partial [Alphaproteobacteria bacterium]